MTTNEHLTKAGAGGAEVQVHTPNPRAACPAGPALRPPRDPLAAPPAHLGRLHSQHSRPPGRPASRPCCSGSQHSPTGRSLGGGSHLWPPLCWHTQQDCSPVHKRRHLLPFAKGSLLQPGPWGQNGQRGIVAQPQNSAGGGERRASAGAQDSRQHKGVCPDPTQQHPPAMGDAGGPRCPGLRARCP